MKTNIIVSSSDRELFGITIRQETKTGMLNLSDLQDAYDSQRLLNGWGKKLIQNMISYNENLERIYYLAKKQGFINSCLSEFMEESKTTTPAKLLKKYGLYVTKGARENKTTWANPYLWVMLAMEMNPMLYAEVVGWLTDKLILNRIEAGNVQIVLSENIESKLVPTLSENGRKFIFSNISKLINKKIFGKHELNIRNSATEDQLSKLRDMELEIATLLKVGYLKSYGDIKEYVNKNE